MDETARLDRLRRCLDDALVEVVEAVRERLGRGERPRRRAEPKLDIESNGMAKLSDGSLFSPEGLPEWAAMLDPAYDADPEVRRLGRYPPDQFPAVARYQTFVEDNASALLAMRDIDGLLRPYYARFTVDALVDSHFLRFGDRSTTASERRRLIDPMLSPFQNAVLPIAVLAPIAMVGFECDRLRLGPRVFLIRMSGALQRARWEGKAWGGKGHDSVLGAASHAVVLTGWQIRNDGGLKLSALLSSRQDELREAIEKVFAALRLVTGIETGYAQEIRMARGWRLHARPGWPEIYAAGARRYPENFDDFGWTRPTLPQVTRDQLRIVAKVYRDMGKNLNPRVQMALRRFNAAMTRDDPADGLLDATIALEILLGDSSAQAVSWKLRMRAAALVSRTQPDEDVRRTLKAVTEVYASRSAIVHGSTGKGRRVDPWKARGAAVNLLRQVMLALLETPRYLDPRRIDEDLLLGLDQDDPTDD